MDLILPAVVSFLITIITVPFTIILAKKFKLLDHPKLRPHPAHIQQRIVPRAGGLPVFIGISAAMLLFTPFEKYTIGILVGLTILLVIGLLDDKYQNISPYLRLLVQFLAAVTIVSMGVGIAFITNPLGGIIHFDTNPQMMFLADILAVIWIVWVMNMVNWAKGVDGQMPGVITVAALVLGIVAIKSQDPAQLNLAKLSFITAGSAFALLIFNWHPAKIFPGFSGSTGLGFMIAVLAILSGGKVATAGLVLLIPATDFAYTFIRRILEGKSPVWGDRGHLHHRLLEQGFSHEQIALFYILGSVILGAAALSLSSSGKLFAAALVGTIILGGILWLNFFGQLQKPSDPDNG